MIDRSAKAFCLGDSQAVAGQKRRQRAAVGRRGARGIFSVEVPGSVGSLVARKLLGGLQQGFAILDPARRYRCRERPCERHAGQAFVNERAFAAVVVPRIRFL